MKIPFLPLLIGSLPHTNPEEGVEAVFRFFPDSPTWPQFPKISHYEGMNLQYLENIPGWFVNQDKLIFKKAENNIDEISEFLEYALDDKYEKFYITEKRAIGLSIFLKKLRDKKKPAYIKGQVIGPVTFLASHTLEDGTRLYKDEVYAEAIPLFLRQKALFQYYEFKKISPGSDVIIFFDEPILSEIGSAVTNIELSTAEKILSRALQNVPFVSGMHICGNSDWDFILRMPINIINFDAYNYLEEFLLYKKSIKDFVTKGCSIALGIIPTNKEDLKKIDEKTLLSKTLYAIESLKDITGVDNIGNKIIVTPSCGMGTLDVEECYKIFNLINYITGKLK